LPNFHTGTRQAPVDEDKKDDEDTDEASWIESGDESDNTTDDCNDAGSEGNEDAGEKWAETTEERKGWVQDLKTNVQNMIVYPGAKRISKPISRLRLK
jgi:hypothetical protein